MISTQQLQLRILWATRIVEMQTKQVANGLHGNLLVPAAPPRPAETHDFHNICNVRTHAYM